MGCFGGIFGKKKAKESPPRQVREDETIQRGKSFLETNTLRLPKSIDSKKAILIGAPGSGPINDVCIVQNLLVGQFGFSYYDVIRLTTENHSNGAPSPDNILAAMDWLLAGAKPGDNLFILCSEREEKIFKNLVDEQLLDTLVKGLPQGCRLTALVDSSCSILNLPHKWNFHGEPAEDNSKDSVETAADVVLLSCCGSVSEEIEVVSSGMLTHHFVQCLKINPEITYQDLLQTIQRKTADMSFQSPQLSSSSPLDMKSSFKI